MFAHFFILGPAPEAMQGSYNPWLVALSYIVATCASFLALILARYISVAHKPKRKRMLIWGGAMALGGGIWAMHFIGMLAFDMNMPVEYDPETTLLSLLVAMASAYGVLTMAGRDRLRPAQLIGAAILLGIGIAAMHYIGMESMSMDADILYRPGLFLLSILIAITASGAALWISFYLARNVSRIKWLLKTAAALIMGGAICGMHYVGMAAAVFVPAAADMDDFTVSGVALGVGIVGVIISLIVPWAIYQMVRDEQEGKDSASVFPTKLLSLTVLFSLGVLFVLAGYSLHARYLINLEKVMSLSESADVAAHLGWMAIIAIVSGILMAVVWYFVMRSIRAWRSELRSNKALLQTVLDNMPLALFVKDAADQYRWLYINRMAEEMFDMSGADIVGKLDHDLFPAAEADFFHTIDVHVMDGHKLFDIAQEHITNKRGTFIGHTIKVPIYNEDGTPHMLIGMVEDVTNEIRAKNELQLAKEQAEKADHAKSEFLANMSHELRTPLNSILGMTRLLQDSGISTDQRALTETVMASSVNLLEIVNDILDLSKIEAGAVELEQIGFDLSYVLDSAVDSLTQLAREKKLSLKKWEDAPPPYVVGDPTRLSRILTNLISNAIKYTDHGAVEIKTIYTMTDEGFILYRCEISDTGIGIPAEKQATVFDKFVQADTSTTRKYGGTGLGLAITKQLVERMGGTIGLHSDVGKGSIFWFEIPFRVTDQLHREKGSHRSMLIYNTLKPAETRVLVAEDNPMNQVLIAHLLRRFGLNQFKIVATGTEAVEQVTAGGWDMVLMDCHMPEKNGYDAAIEIRAMEKKKGGQIPIIAMTANAMVGDREKCLRCGMDDYISKPLMLEELAKLLGQWIDLENSGVGAGLENMQAPVIDLTQLRSITEGDLAMERELVDLFIRQSNANLKALAAAAIDGVSKEWVEAAHMLKGSSMSIGARQLSDLCAEAQAMDNIGAATRIALLKQINQAYDQVRQSLIKEGLVNQE